MTFDHIGFTGAGIMVQFCCRGADQQGGVPVDLDACFRGLDRRLKGLFPGTAAEVFQRDTHSVDLARNRNRGCTDLNEVLSGDTVAAFIPLSRIVDDPNCNEHDGDFNQYTHDSGQGRA